MANKRCSQCGLPIPDSDLGNRCPNCLLELAITPLPDGPMSGALPLSPLRHTPLTSRFFADYEILEEIARGGMGVVYRARQLSLNREVALKLIQSGLLASPDALLRFQVEVRAVAQLNHPNIVSLHEAGEHDGQHYFSMGLIEGGNLAERISKFKAQSSNHHSVRLLIKVTRAVHHAHQRGILHRDLKPSNILLDKTGEPHVTDFGLAKVVEGDSGLTRTESVVGSPNYMAPEQAAGHSHEVTTAADVYSLGAILYEMLTGRPPFQAGTVLETMRLVAEKDPAPVRKFNPRVDAGLETICLKCLRKEPKARYGSAEELAQDLECWLERRPIRARPVGTLGSLWLWSRRHPAVALLSVALVLALIGIAVGSSIAVVRVSRAERRATANLRESLLNQTRALRLTSLMGSRGESLNNIRQAAALGGSPEFRRQLRDELLAALARTELSFVPQPQLPSSQDPALNLLAPRFDLWATVINHRTIVVVTAAEGRELKRFDVGESPVQSLESFSDDGRYLGLRQAGGVAVWDINRGQRCFTTNNPACVFCFTSGSTGLVVQVGRKVAVVLELPSMNEVRRLEPYADADRAPTANWVFMACSPNGRILAAQGWSTRITGLIDFETGKLRHYVTNFGVGRCLSWSADSGRLGVGNHRHRVAVWDANTGSRVFGSGAFPAEVQTLALDDSGTMLAAGFEDRILRLFDVEATRLVAECPGVTHRLAFDQRGTRIGPIFCNGVTGWLQLERSAEFFETAVTDTSVQLRQLQWSSDGRIVAVGTDTNVVFCDPSTGATLMNLRGWRIKTTCLDPQEPFVLSERGPGLFRRKLHWSDAGKLALTDSEKLFPERGWHWTFSARGDVLVGANSFSNKAIVFDRTFTNKLAEVGPHQGVEFATISPDTHWVATGSSADRHLRIWETRTAREVLPVAALQRPRAAFSPDGKWVAIFGKTFELREVGSWKPISLPRYWEREPVLSAAAFSPDSRILAVIADQGAVQLIDLASFQSLGLLQPPGYVPIDGLAFSPDGTRLAAVGDAARLRVWNLPRIRQRLAEYGLDWDLAVSATKVSLKP